MKLNRQERKKDKDRERERVREKILIVILLRALITKYNSNNKHNIDTKTAKAAQAEMWRM